MTEGTLDFHANQLFNAKHGKSDSISEWIQRIQTLGSKFREAALTDCTEEERAGILMLSDRLQNICLTQDRIHTILRSRNNDNFDEIAECSLEEGSALISKLERYRRQDNTTSLQCTISKKSGHTSCNCFLRQKNESRVNQYLVKGETTLTKVICYHCGETGHISKFCKKLRKSSSKDRQKAEKEGNERRSLACSQQTVHSVQ
jgi:hypothetical protein